jgi:hypothetical protein
VVSLYALFLQTQLAFPLGYGPHHEEMCLLGFSLPSTLPQINHCCF